MLYIYELASVPGATKRGVAKKKKKREKKKKKKKKMAFKVMQVDK